MEEDAAPVVAASAPVATGPCCCCCDSLVRADPRLCWGESPLDGAELFEKSSAADCLVFHGFSDRGGAATGAAGVSSCDR